MRVAFLVALAIGLVPVVVSPALSQHAALEHEGHRCPDIKSSPGTPADFPRGTFDVRRLIDKRLPRAREIARKFRCTIAVVKRDGVVAPAGPNNISYVRVNVAVWDGRISRILGVG